MIAAGTSRKHPNASSIGCGPGLSRGWNAWRSSRVLVQRLSQTILALSSAVLAWTGPDRLADVLDFIHQTRCPIQLAHASWPPSRKAEAYHHLGCKLA